MIRSLLISCCFLWCFGASAQFIYKSDNWPVTFDYQDASPYGANMLYELLKDTRSEKEMVVIQEDPSAFLADHPINPGKNYLYVMLAKDIYIREKDWDEIYAFAAEGNEVLMAVEYLPYPIEQEFFDTPWQSAYRYTLRTYLESSISEFWEEPYSFTYQQNFDSARYNWRFFYEESILPKDESDFYTILWTDHNLQGVKIPVGDGAITFVSNPLLFSNLSLRNEDGFEFAREFFAPYKDHRILWDEYSRLPYDDLLDASNESSASPPRNYMSPMHFILSQPSLAAAYLSILIAAFLYALLNSKRRQRPVPLKESRENLSMQFVETVSHLYLRNGNHLHIIRQQEKVFLNYLNRKYRLDYKRLTPDDVPAIALRTGIEEERIERIVRVFNEIRKDLLPNADTLTKAHQELDYFYKHCK